MTIRLGLTCSSLTEYPRWHSETREVTSHGLWCCIPELTSKRFGQWRKISVHCFWTIASKFQWSRTRWITSSYGLLWLCACEGVHNPDIFRLSVWAPNPCMLESVWRRWWCLGGCSGDPITKIYWLFHQRRACLTRFEILIWGIEHFEANMAWWYCFMC